MTIHQVTPLEEFSPTPIFHGQNDSISSSREINPTQTRYTNSFAMTNTTTLFLE
jgi:hypothetical protein